MPRLPLALFFALSTLAARDLVRIPATEHDLLDERTGVKTHVRIPAFRIAPTECTQDEYRAITGANPSHHKGANLPVENVSWWDAVRYCNARSRRENLQPCYHPATGQPDPHCTGYRLPTEAEWTVAAADHTTPSPKTSRLGLRDVTSRAALLAREQEGTAPVATLAPNRYGVYDMLGNVWEWCQDIFDVVRTFPPALHLDPPDPSRARLIRGGGYLTSPAWAKAYRSSLMPDTRSPNTGFRVAQNEPTPAPPITPTISISVDPPPSTTTGDLPTRTPEAWRADLPAIRQKWTALLGACAPALQAPRLHVLSRTTHPGYTATLADLDIEPGVTERIYLMQPDRPDRRPLPVVIVPFYDVDTSAAEDLGGRNFTAPGVRSFALMAVQQGYLAVAVRWFAEGDGESYAEAVANLAQRHPHCTGLGKWVADARTLVNYLLTRTEVDPHRIGIVGHSLGAKMSLYAAAFDDRIKVAVASEPGMGFKQSNYDAYWYFGEALAAAPPGTDQHELLALLAPRPFLLIGGDQYDTAESWRYLNAARPAYALHNATQNLAYINHHTGHSPTPEAAAKAIDWIRQSFDQP